MARRPSFYFFLAVLLNVFLFAYPAHSQEGKIVRSLKIEGNKRVDDSTILYYVKTKIGEPLSRALIRRDIEQINSLGQFKNIRVETQTTSKGLEVIFVVEEIPSIGNVKITGNDVVDTQDIRDRITIKRGTTFHEHLVRETTGEIQLLYHDKGYFFVAVKIDTQASGNQVDVRIKIVEGEKVGIKRIRFIGNKTFKDKALLGEMETKKKSWISFLDDSGIYKKDVLKVDLLRVESFYHDHGFIRVRVLEPKIDVDRKSKKIYITIPVEEGARYRTGKINIEGDDTFTSEELRIAMKTREGDVYNVSQLRNDVLAITELYSGKGYAYADVTPKTKIDDKARKVDLSISAEKGRKVYIGKIDIIGNTKTRDNVVRREFRLKEGDLYDGKKLKRSKQRINNLRFFEDVKIDTHPGEKPDLIDIETTLTERSTGSLSAGVGFSSVENFIFTAAISQDNLFGRGQRVSFSVELSSRRTNFNLAFTDPRLWDSDISGGIDLFNKEKDFISFDSDSRGGGVRLGKFFGEYDWVGVGYRFADTTISDVDAEDETEFLRNETRTTSRITPSYIRDTRDDHLNPTTGMRHGLQFEVAGGVLGGSDFLKAGYGVSYYRPLIGKLVGMVHAEINWADGYNDETLPAFERFFMGGSNSLRGFNIRDVGPKDADGDVLGGDQSLLFNVEAQYPITKNFRAFVFYDRGNVYGDGPDLSTTADSFSLTEMRSGIGVGVRFLSPFGPIGLAYGIKLDKEDDEDLGEFHFSAGSVF